MTEYAKRTYRASDENFVVSTWLRSYAHSQNGKLFGAKDGRVWDTRDHIWTEHRRVVMSLIYETRVDVICDVEDDTQVYAWACHEPGALHYAIVKLSAVAAGFGAEMLGQLIGGMTRSALLLSHEPVWCKHIRETREAYEARHPEWAALVQAERARTGNRRARGPKPPTSLLSDHGAPLPYYYQDAEAWFPIPRTWKYDENFLARKWCPVRAA